MKTVSNLIAAWFVIILLNILIYGGSIFLVIGGVVWCLRHFGVLR